MTPTANFWQERALPAGVMRFDRDRVRFPDELLFDPAAPQLNAMPVQVGGRQAAWYVTGDFGSGVLRHYQIGRAHV